MIISKESRECFIAIPKSGTTTILSAIQPLGFEVTGKNATWKPHKWPQAGRHDPCAPRGYYRFVVVRNPIRRLQSQYNDFVKSPQKWEHEGKYDNCSLEEFCEMSLSREANERPWFHLNQAQFISNIHIDLVLRLEDIAEAKGFQLQDRWVPVTTHENSHEYEDQKVPDSMRDWIEEDAKAFGY